MGKEYLIKEETLKGIADAIRSKDGTTESIRTSDFKQRIQNIPTSEDTLEKLFSETLEVYQNNKITKLPTYAFYKNTSIKTIILNNVTSTDVVYTRNSYSFSECANLEEVSLENLTVLSNYMFQNCKKLTKINLPNVKSFNAGEQSFGYTFNNVGIDSADKWKLILPNLVGIGINRSVFAGCGAAIMSFPRMTGASGFYECFKECKTQIIDLGSTIAIYSSSFTNAQNLKTLILRKTTILSLPNISAFDGTPFATDNTGGDVYVPESLIESYKIATNWSILYEGGTLNFKPIEGSIYENLDWADDFDVTTLEVK